MAAYKIIYGAGPTLTREESRFGRGYGFVGMHRHPAVKELAFGTLESHLHGKNIYELEKRWMGVFSAGPEIAAFHQIGDWAVLIRISAKQTEGRLWSFEEFLLIDSDGVKSLSERQVTPAEVLLWSGPGPDGTPLWHRDSLWAEPASWYSDPLELEILSFDQAIPGGPDPGLAPFRFPACDWAVAREGTEEERTLLPAYARAQQNLLQKIRETPGGISSDGFREIFWERLTFTTFDLDPSRVLDLSFGTGEPHVWDGLWEGIHDPGRLDSPEALAWPPRLDEEGGAEPLAASRQEIEQAGWLEPLPVETPAAVPVTPKFDEPASNVTAPRGTGRIDKSRFQVAPPRQKRKKTWNLKIWGMVVVIALIVLVPTLFLIKSSREKERIDSMVTELWDALQNKDGDGSPQPDFSKVIPKELENKHKDRVDPIRRIKDAREDLRAYLNNVQGITVASSPLPEVASLDKYGSFLSEDSPEFSKKLDQSFRNAWGHLELYKLLQNQTKEDESNKLSAELLGDVTNWLSRWQALSKQRNDAHKGFSNLGLEELANKADASIIDRAKAWVSGAVTEKNGKVSSSDIILDSLRKLAELDKTGLLDISKLLESIEQSKSSDLTKKGSNEADSPGPTQTPTKTTDSVPPAASEGTIDITAITIERPDGAGYFKLPSKEFRETAKVALMSLPMEHAKLLDGRIHLLASEVNAAMATARPLSISKKYVKIEGEGSKPIGEVSSDGLAFKPIDSQPLAFVEGGRLRVFQFPGMSFAVHPDYVGANSIFAVENQVGDLISINEAPPKWAHLQATLGTGKPSVDISLPLPEGVTLGAAIAEAFQKPANSASSDEAGNKLGAELFKRWFWDPPLTGKGGLLEEVKGLQKVPHYNNDKNKAFLGYSNTPCPLGATPPDSPKGRTQIDSFVIAIKRFPDFMKSGYHTGNTGNTGNTFTLAGITAQFLSELSKNLDASKDDLLTPKDKLSVGPESKFPNHYFPWDQNVILASMGKRQNLNELVRDFAEIAAGKAPGFKEGDYNVTKDPVTNLPHTNHQILNKRFHELGKDLPRIAAFLEWADKLFPPGTTPAKERFEKALAEAIGAGEKDKKAKDETDKKLEAIAKGDLKDVKVKLILPGF